MKRNRLWSGILAAVMITAMMGQTVLAQNVTAETKVQEEATAAEVKVTGIRMEGNAYNSKAVWTTGDVLSDDTSVFVNIVQGMNVMVSYSDGSEAKLEGSVTEWSQKGVRAIVKDKSTGDVIEMVRQAILPGSYEVFLSYQGFSCKAADFVVKSIEEEVQAAITTDSEIAVQPQPYRKTIMKFVADKPGYYTFQAVRKEDPDYKYYMDLRDTKSVFVASQNGTSLFTYLEAGTYYLKVRGDYAFTLSVKEQSMKVSGITVSGSSYYNAWSVGDVIANVSNIMTNVVQGMDVMQVFEDGTKAKINGTPSQLIAAGVTVTLKNKDTGSTVALDDQVLPAGNYEVFLNYQSFVCKARDFTIKSLEEAVNATITMKSNTAEYSAISGKTVTKFVADKPGYYIFRTDVKGNPNAEIYMNLYNEDISYQKTQYSAEPLQVFLKAGTYYIKNAKGDAHTVSVSGKEVRSMKFEEPEETERLYLISDVKNWRDVAGVREENVNSLYHWTNVELEYEDSTRETRSLNELLGSWNFLDWGERIWNIMTGEPGGTTSDPLNIGIYELRYWSDTSETMTDENLDLCYNFIIYKGFQDVALTDWFVYPVAYVSAAGMMTGMGDGTNFGPAENLSRAQFATILYRMEGSPDVTYREVFPDVKDEEFYTNAVLWANENKVVTGYADTGTFGPADNITREQMAVMLYRFAQYKGYDVSESIELDSFPDHEKVSEFAEKAMKWASATELIRGDQGNINPQGNASRAQCATIMMRFSDKYM